MSTYFESALAGRTFTGTGRRGKFLWLATDDPDLVLAAHLGMSGQFRVDVPGDSPDDPDRGPHRHARARFDLGEPGASGSSTSGRSAGSTPAPSVPDRRGVLVPDLVRGIAPDPTEPAFDVRAVARAMRTHRVEVKRLLLGQDAGLGHRQHLRRRGAVGCRRAPADGGRTG